MPNRRSPLAHALGTLAIGAALVLISSVGAQATDAIDDPIRQPHLKAWSNIIPNAAKRFVVLADFNDQAVLDRETGLVWEQSPLTTITDWNNARFQCINRTTGGRKGWRLPSVHELASLIDPDPSVPAPGPVLPLGHPFTNVQPASYWSASTNADVPTSAWNVVFLNGFVGNDGKTLNSSIAWCVRGGMNADRY